MNAPMHRSRVGRALPVTAMSYRAVLERRALPALRDSDVAWPFFVSAGEQ